MYVFLVYIWMSLSIYLPTFLSSYLTVISMNSFSSMNKNLLLFLIWCSHSPRYGWGVPLSWFLICPSIKRMLVFLALNFFLALQDSLAHFVILYLSYLIFGIGLIFFFKKKFFLNKLCSNYGISYFPKELWFLISDKWYLETKIWGLGVCLVTTGAHYFWILSVGRTREHLHFRYHEL